MKKFFALGAVFAALMLVSGCSSSRYPGGLKGIWIDKRVGNAAAEKSEGIYIGDNKIYTVSKAGYGGLATYYSSPSSGVSYTKVEVDDYSGVMTFGDGTSGEYKIIIEINKKQVLVITGGPFAGTYTWDNKRKPTGL